MVVIIKNNNTMIELEMKKTIKINIMIRYKLKKNKEQISKNR